MTKRKQIKTEIEKMLIKHNKVMYHVDDDYIYHAIDKILEITKPKPRKLSEEKYRKELLRRGIKFRESKFQRHWKSAKSIMESDVWEEND